MKPSQPKHAFTLIELLVVVAIITALLAILMPSLNKAVMTAEMAVCASNVRQLYQGHLNYMADSMGFVPHSNDYLGMSKPDRPHGSIFIERGYLGETVDVFMCPGDDGQRTDYRALLPAFYSYARNSSPVGATAHGNIRATQIALPATTPLLMEEHPDAPMNDGYVVASTLDNIADRHFDQGNFAYFDGHVAVYDAVEYNNLPDILRRKVMDPTYPY